MTTKTLVQVFQEINQLLNKLQRERGFSKDTCLLCCERLYPTAEAFWEHLHNHTRKEVEELQLSLLRELTKLLRENNEQN